MSYGSLIFEVKDGVGLIRLNRPDDGNAITLEMANELLDVASRFDQDPEVRALVLIGSGKMFCVGGDLKVFAAQGEVISGYMQKVVQAFHGAISRFNWMDAPVIGAINGTAAGGGFSPNHRYRHCGSSSQIYGGLYQKLAWPWMAGRATFSAPGGDAPGQRDGAPQPGVVGQPSPGMGNCQSSGGR